MVYLREMGEEFAKMYPKLAPYLAHKSNDPDIERLLEGFAFMSSRLRQKLDDEIPEFTHTLIDLMWPHLLRPVPATSVLQFTPMPNSISEKKMVKRGVEVDSVPVEGTTCRFRTSYDVDLYPIELKEVDYLKKGGLPVLSFNFDIFPGASLAQMDMDKLRLYINGESHISQLVYLWLFEYVRNITVQVKMENGETAGITLDADSIKPVGFSDEEALIPFPDSSFPGFRLLQEYFTLPEKFYFFDICDLQALAELPEASEFEISIEFSKPIEDNIRLTKSNFLLYCSPIVNLFDRDADPIRLDHKKNEYMIRPSSTNHHQYDIFSVDEVVGWQQGTSIKQTYYPFLAFSHRENTADNEVYYKTRVSPSVLGGGLDTLVSFVNVNEENVIPVTEVVSVELTCTNKNMPNKLKVGDIMRATSTSPEVAKFKNIITPRPTIHPPSIKGAHWMLISNMSLNYSSLASIEALRTVISTYNFRAYYDKQAQRVNDMRLQGIENINVEPMTIMYKGAPIRGLKTRLNLRSSKFGGDGEMYLFACVLQEYFSQYVSINSFNQLQVRDVERGEEFKWAPKLGTQPLM